MTTGTIIGIALVLCAIIGVGLLSGRKVKDSKDFLTGGGKAGSMLVCGAIMGSLVSSQSTIGTAQLAFNYGLAAWWFTLGAGIGCLMLAVGYARSLRRSNCITELQIISREYGPVSGSLGSILCSIGIFISVLAQVVACTGLLSAMIPGFSITLASIVGVVFMCIYVIFGGAWGAGMGGVLKLLLLYAASIVGLIFVMISSGGAGGLLGSLREALVGTDLGAVQGAANGLSNISSDADVTARFLNLTARGAAKDIGSGVSLLLGVLSTQTYAQAIWSARTDRKAKGGALLSACLIPPLGIAGIGIGLYMRTHYILQAEVDALIAAGQAVPDLPVLSGTIQVFPAFVINHMPPLVSGIILGTLFITVVGGGAGLSLGMATIMVKDIYKRVTNKIDTPKKELFFTRLTIGVILAIAAVIAILVPSSTINDFGFLSMGLRGSVVFVPLSCALWFKGRIDRRCVVASIVLSPAAVLVGKLAKVPFDSLFIGIAVSVLCCAVGWLIAKTGASPRLEKQ